jgi:hypothetical protein
MSSSGDDLTVMSRVGASFNVKTRYLNGLSPRIGGGHGFDAWRAAAPSRRIMAPILQQEDEPWASHRLPR